MINDLLPIYANGRANRIQRWLVERHLAKSASARKQLTLLRQVRSQTPTERRTPSAAVWKRIEVELSQPQQVSLNPQLWRLGMGLAVFLLVLVWFAFPPQVVLEWRVEGVAPEEFHIYRSSENDRQGFTLVKEIPAASVTSEYRFVDLQLVPAREVTYKIEAVSESGTPITSETVLMSGGSTLPSQLALLLSVIVSFYGAKVFFSDRKHWPEHQFRLALH